MTKGELAKKLAAFKFQDFDTVNDICLKAADAFGFSAGEAFTQADKAVEQIKGIDVGEGEEPIKVKRDFLQKLNIKALLGLIFWVYKYEDFLGPWKRYEDFVREVFDMLVKKASRHDRRDARIDSFRARRNARYDASAVGRYRARKADRLDAKWITIGATGPDPETGELGHKGRHVLIDDEGVIVSGAGGSMTGVKLKGAKSSSGEVKVDPSKVSTAAVGAGESKTGGAPTGEGGSASGAEPKVEPKIEPKVEPKAEKKLRVVSSGEEFADAAKTAEGEEAKKAILEKMAGGSKLTIGGETYRKKTNGEWVLDGHKKPVELSELCGKDWSDAKVESPVDRFKDYIEKDNAQGLEEMLSKYAVGTIIQFKRDGKWALERKNSGWVVTNSKGVWSGLNLKQDEYGGFKDHDAWKGCLEGMDNWYVTRRKDTSSVEPDKALVDMFEKEFEKDGDHEFEDLLNRCEVGTEITVDGKTIKAVRKDGSDVYWESDNPGEDYFEGDSWYFSNELNKATSIRIGGKTLGESKAFAKGRETAKADWEKYTTPEYLKKVPSLKHYDNKVKEYRENQFKVFTDADLEACNKHLEKIFDNAEYCARFSSHVVDSMIEKGLLNQFETGTTGGYHDPGKGSRYHASHKMFGTEEKHDGEYVSGKEFEKYGFMMERDKIGEDTGASWYGDCCLVFDKDAVKDRVTFTGGDSLSLHYEPGKAGKPPTVFGLLSRDMTYSESDKKDFMNKLMSCKSITDLRKSVGWSSYIEAQYHGDMPISTVKEIILQPGTKMSAKSQETCAKYGIKITYEDIG